MSSEGSFFPFVLWGQTKECLYLTVKLSEVKNPAIDVDDEKITFKAQGVGAQGKATYSFTLDIYLPIKAKESKWEVKDRCVEFVLRKEYVDAWPRLTLQHTKLPWVRFDFDRFQFDTSDEEEENAEVNEEQLAEKQAEQLVQQMDEAEAFMKLLKNPLTIYLLLFNLFQTAGFLFLFGSCIYNVFRDGSKAKKELYDKVIDQLAIVQLVSILEVVHAALGWVKSKVIATLMQVFGRNLVLFAIIIPHEELHSSEYFYWLIVAWSSIEVVRYPFYLLNVIGEKNDFLTYLRYTLWVPFYPMGFMMEGFLILIAMPEIDEKQKFCLTLPNQYNFSFNFPIFLKIYLLAAIFGFYFLMMHMYKLRRVKIGPAPTTSLTSLYALPFQAFRKNKPKACTNGKKSEFEKPLKAA